jgi:hypothetical protein
MRFLLSLIAVAQAYGSGVLSVTFKDCGVNAYAKVLTVAPDSLPLGKTTTVSGTGQVKKGRIALPTRRTHRVPNSGSPAHVRVVH